MPRIRKGSTLHFNGTDYLVDTITPLGLVLINGDTSVPTAYNWRKLSVFGKLEIHRNDFPMPVEGEIITVENGQLTPKLAKIDFKWVE